jgi:hypothetical protein
MKDKKQYSTPAVQVKIVAVENGFQLSLGNVEGITNNHTIDF